MAIKKSRRDLYNACRGTRHKDSWATDYDYLDSLSDDALHFMISFTEFWYKGNPHKVGHSLIVVTQELRSESYRRNNRSYIDLLNQGLTNYGDDISFVSSSMSEDALIDFIDKR